MSAPGRLVTASDYAVLEVKGQRFYYGYELKYDPMGDEVWGFECITEAGAHTHQRPYETMAQLSGCPDQFDTQGCLLFGIGLWIAEAREP